MDTGSKFGNGVGSLSPNALHKMINDTPGGKGGMTHLTYKKQQTTYR